MYDKYHLTKELNLSLARKMLVSNIYNSTRLEGINITYEGTKKVLEEVNVSSLRLDEINCILNLRDAWDFTLSNIDTDVTLDFICKVNSFVSRNESLEWGVLRNGQVGINGVDYISVKEENIAMFNRLLTEYYNTGVKDKLISFLYDYCIFGLEIN